MGGQQSVPAAGSGTVVQAPKKDDAAFQATLDSLAAEVYDNVQNNLLRIQKQQLSEAEVLAAGVRAKLEPLTVKIETPCVADEQELIKCLQTNKNKPLACAHVVASFESCAAKTVLAKK
jgi:hypothetical protein